jgi:hypothetical protein
MSGYGDARDQLIEETVAEMREDGDWGIITICAGPPKCLLEGVIAEQNQHDGCPTCRRIQVHPGGRREDIVRKPH